MAASPIAREVHLSVGNNIKYTARIIIDRGANRVSVSVDKVDGTMTTELVRGAWVIDFQMKRVAFDVPAFQAALNTACYLGCLVGAGSSIVACVIKARSEDDVWKCIDDNVVILGGSVMGCVIGCA